MQLIFLSLNFLCSLLQRDDKFCATCIPSAVVHLISWSFAFPSPCGKILSIMPFSWNLILSSSPTDPRFCLFMCFCSSCSDSSGYSWNENIIESIFIAVANALARKGHLEVIPGELAQLWQYHSDFILPFIITGRTVKNHMLSALNFGGTGFCPDGSTQTWREPNPRCTSLFSITHKHTPNISLAFGGEWSLPGRERLITFRINQHAAHPLDDISECSSNP